MLTHKHTLPSSTVGAERCWSKGNILERQTEEKTWRELRKKKKLWKFPVQVCWVVLSLPLLFLKSFILYWYSSTNSLIVRNSWAPAQWDRSFHFQPEQPNGRSHPQLLLTPGVPLGSDVVTELLDYRPLRRIMGEAVYFFGKSSEEALLSATSCMERSWIPVMHFGKAMGNACPQNTTAGILDLLCSFLFCPQSPERRKMCHCSQTNIFPVIFQKALLRHPV